jgi:hypothetical protein
MVVIFTPPGGVGEKSLGLYSHWHILLEEFARGNTLVPKLAGEYA